MSRRLQTFLIGLFSAAFALPAVAASPPANGGEPRHEPLAPAQRYSGGTPIDLSHGSTGNNGTFGAPNAEYEAQAKAELITPGLFAGPYSYERRAEFIAALADRIRFFEEAVVNLKETSSLTKPEAKQHSEQAVQRIENLLGQTRDALKRARSAGASEWSSAQDSARTAFISLYGTYKSLHTAQ